MGRVASPVRIAFFFLDLRVEGAKFGLEEMAMRDQAVTTGREFEGEVVGGCD